MLVQYPDRNARRPYGPLTNQTPLSLRLKPETGLVELDIPIDTAHNYNRSRGNTYASSLQKSRILHAGGSHGLAGGFNTGPGSRVYRADDDGDVDMRTIPQHSSGLGGTGDDESELKTQTLGGKIAKATDGDPVYMLGAFRGPELHLRHLDSLVQVRPQLHHLDAADENARGAPRPLKKGEPTEKLTTETRAVEIKVKSSDEKNADRTRKRTNPEMLTAIQQESWETYTWLDSSEPSTVDKLNTHLYHPRPYPSTNAQLTSALSPSAYLDAISAPRLSPLLSNSPNASHHHRSLGLMSKIRGRERERRRRKRQTDTAESNRRKAEAKAKLEDAQKKTRRAVERGEMSKEEAESVVRSTSHDIEAGETHDLEDEDGSSGDSSSEEEEEGEGDKAADDAKEDDEVQLVKSQPASLVMVGTVGKRPRGRPRKSDVAAANKIDPVVVVDD